MTRLRYCWILLIAAPVLSASAEAVDCEVEIKDVNAQVQKKADSKQVIQFSFESTLEAEARRKHFQLPDGLYSCTLAFFDLNSGTSLSCERKDDQGHTYVQSDRSGISEHAARNNLIFRDGDSHFVLNARCK